MPDWKQMSGAALLKHTLAGLLFVLVACAPGGSFERAGLYIASGSDSYQELRIGPDGKGTFDVWYVRSPRNAVISEHYSVLVVRRAKAYAVLRFDEGVHRCKLAMMQYGNKDMVDLRIGNRTNPLARSAVSFRRNNINDLNNLKEFGGTPVQLGPPLLPDCD
jgi:hypothetical protein